MKKALKVSLVVFLLTVPIFAQEGPPKSEPVRETIVYVTKTGKSYHRGSCGSLKQSKIEIKLSDAKRRGFAPCRTCRPEE